MANILITGASGYLGGTLLARWKTANLPAHGKLYALVRNDEQARAVTPYGAEPFICGFDDPQKMRSGIVDRHISIVFFLVDGGNDQKQRPMIAALAEVKKATGKEVHFLHTTGAKLFSSHVDINPAEPLLDTDPGLYGVLRGAGAGPDRWAKVGSILLPFLLLKDLRWNLVTIGTLR